MEREYVRENEIEEEGKQERERERKEGGNEKICLLGQLIRCSNSKTRELKERNMRVI